MGELTTKDANPLPRKLWTWKDYLEYLGVGERTGYDLEAQGYLAEPVYIGPRTKRYFPDECEAKARSMPRTKPAEPVQLATARRARIDAMKAGPSGQAAA